MSDPYVEFQPYVATVRPPRSSAEEASPESQTAVRSMVYPVAVTIDLSLIGGTNQKDYFLVHPFQSSVQELFLSAPTKVAAPSGFKIQLIETDGFEEVELTDATSISSFTVDPVSLPLPASLGGTSLFLRVFAPATAQVIYVTAHMMCSEVI